MSGNIRKLDPLSQNPSKMRIKAFPTSLSDQSVSQIWGIIKRAIIEIQRRNNSGLSFEELYRNAYTMILQKNGEHLYNGTKSVITNHMMEVREEVYQRLTNNFLNFLNKCWKEHITAMVMIRDILMYMDRVYVVQTDKPDVYNMGMIIFRDTVLRYEPIRCQLRATLLDMVRRERNGEVISRSQLRDACQMLVQLGVDRLIIYEEDFESYFLEQSREFYRTESEKLLEENPSNLYIKHVDQIIEDEAKRAREFLHSTTESKIVHVLNEELIKNHIDKIVNNENSGLIHMLTNKKYAEILLMYSLLYRVDGGLLMMSSCISRYLREEGRKIVEDDKTPQNYIQELIVLRDKSTELLMNALSKHQMFKNQMNADFEYFINQNSRSPEYLSLYIDDKLKRGTKGISDQDIDALFDKCITLFRYLQDKDVFERYYKQHLAKRLLMSKSQSDDQEKSMISKLFIECGGVFTSKLEGMFKDMAISKTLMDEFNKDVVTYTPNTIGFDLYVRVLTTGLWPTQTVSQLVVLPDEAQAAFNNYARFYLNKHNGRVIHLQPNLGGVELTAYYNTNNNVTMITSTTQLFPTTNPTTTNHQIQQSSYCQESSITSSLAVGSNCPTTNISTSNNAPLQNSPDFFSLQSQHLLGDVGSTQHQSQQMSATPQIGQNRKYILQVSTYQMIVLMKFNRKSRYTYGELLEETKIPERDLTRCLISLSLSKPTQRLLIKEPKNKSTEFQSTDTFSINESFSSKHIKIKIQSISVKESEPEVKETKTKVDENRKYVIEATIVRIMKSRKSSAHNQLFTEVMEQLKTRFIPTPQMVKQRIESLLERDFLARSDDDKKIYHYLA